MKAIHLISFLLTMATMFAKGQSETYTGTLSKSDYATFQSKIAALVDTNGTIVGLHTYRRHQSSALNDSVWIKETCDTLKGFIGVEDGTDHQVMYQALRVTCVEWRHHRPQYKAKNRIEADSINKAENPFDKPVGNGEYVSGNPTAPIYLVKTDKGWQQLMRKEFDFNPDH